MLKKRIIPVQLLLDKRLVKTKKFGTYVDVGNPIKSSKMLLILFLYINR